MLGKFGKKQFEPVKIDSKMLLRHHSICVKSPGAISSILMFPALLMCNAL